VRGSVRGVWSGMPAKCLGMLRKGYGLTVRSWWRFISSRRLFFRMGLMGGCGVGRLGTRSGLGLGSIIPPLLLLQVLAVA